MSHALRADAAPDLPMGHARIVIPGLAAPPPDPSFTLRRENFDRANLGPDGWQVAEARLRPVSAGVQGSDTVLVVGPAVSQHVESGPVVFALPDAGIEGRLFWPEIDVFVGDLPSADAAPAPPSQAPPPPRPAPAASLPASPADPLSSPVEPPPSPAAVARPLIPAKSPRKPLLVVIAAAMVAGAAAWWFLADAERTPVRFPSPPPPQLPPAQPAPPPAPAAAPWPEGTDGLSLPDLVARAPDATAIHAAALRRQAAGRHDDALVLFEEAAERGHAPALTALARLYDPDGFVPGRPFRTPDPRASARYYRDAVERGDPAAAAPRAALRSTLEAQAREDNSTAASALREFWP